MATLELIHHLMSTLKRMRVDFLLPGVASARACALKTQVDADAGLFIFA